MSSDYMSGPHDGPKCSCKHDGTQWLRRCVAATTNDRQESARWAADHVRRNPDTTFTDEYLALAVEGGLRSTCRVGNEDLR